MAQPPPASASRPGTPQLGAGTPTPGAARPPGAGAGPAGTPIQTILQNLPNLFSMQAKGTLSELQINQLRQLMHTHYRQVISSSISQGRPNPLLTLPAEIDPTMPYKGRPPLIAKEAYFDLITKYTAGIREAMLQRAASVQAAQAKAAQESANNPNTAGIPGANSNTSLPGAVAAAQSVPSAMAGPGSVNLAAPHPGIMSYQQLVVLMKMTPEARNEWLNKEPERRALFQLSAKHWTKYGPGAANRSASPAPPNANTNAQAAPARPPPSGPTAAQNSNVRPPAPTAPAGVPTIAPAPAPAPAAQATGTSTAPVTQAAGVSEPASALQPQLQLQPQPAPDAAASSTTEPVPHQAIAPAPAPAQTQDSLSAIDVSSAGASAPAPTQPSVAGPSTIAATVGPTTGPTPAFAVALPDAKAFALRPPPPPPEPEPVRRTRKWREFVDELAPGLEMEMSVDEVLGDVLDSLIDEGVRGAVRLAKHRKSDKVELKDMAFFVDRNWDTVVPGFDAMPHKHIHVAPEREKEKKRGKTIAPRAGRLGKGRDED